LLSASCWQEHVFWQEKLVCSQEEVVCWQKEVLPNVNHR